MLIKMVTSSLLVIYPKEIIQQIKSSIYMAIHESIHCNSKKTENRLKYTFQVHK